MKLRMLTKWLAWCGPLISATVSHGRQGPVVVWGTADPLVLAVPSGNFLSADIGADFCIGIRPNQTLMGWGNNGQGEINVPSGTFLSVSCGELHSVAIRTDGTLAAWGYGPFGETIVPSGTFAKAQAGPHHNVGLRSDGTLVQWGVDWGAPVPPSGLFLDIAAGDDFSAAIRLDGTLVAWGRSTGGTLNTPAGQFVAVTAGGDYGAAIRTDGTVVFWGNFLGNPAPFSGAFREIVADFFDLLARRPDGTLVAASTNPGAPAGSFSSIATGPGSGFRLAVVPGPATLPSLLTGLLLTRRRRPI